MAKKILFYYTPLNFQECLLKGNMTYLRNFEIYFSKSYIIYFNTPKTIIKKIGRTVYLGIGGHSNLYVNVLLSPYKLLKIYRRTKPNTLVTTDSVFSFYSSLLIRMYRKYFLFPVFFVNKVLLSDQCSFLKNKIIERIFIKLCYLFAPKISLFPMIGYDAFLEKSKITKNKLIRPVRSVEEFPTYEFMKQSQHVQEEPKAYAHLSGLKLITISRLYKEKLLNELLETIFILKNNSIPVNLFIAGDGPEMDALLHLAKKLGIQDSIHLLGAVENEKLVPYLQNADMYISTLTGTSLREAIICELPVISYSNAMTQKYFEVGNIGYISENNSSQDLANGVLWYLKNPNSHFTIKKNIKYLKKQWSLDSLQESLRKTFEKQ